MGRNIGYEEMILVIENRKGYEKNFLLTVADFKEKYEDYYIVEDLFELMGTQSLNAWSTIHINTNHTVSAAFCGSLEKLGQFLQGKFNDTREDETTPFQIDKDACSVECLTALNARGINISDFNHNADYSYKKEENYVFKKGDIVRNGAMQLRVVQVLPGNDIFFERISDGSYILAHGVAMYSQTPKGELPGPATTTHNVCWNAGDYYSDNLFEIDFEAMRADYYETPVVPKGRKR